MRKGQKEQGQRRRTEGKGHDEMEKENGREARECRKEHEEKSIRKGPKGNDHERRA